MHKFWNFSQSGVTIDPIYVTSSIRQKFCEAFQKQVKSQFGVHTKTNMQVAPSMKRSRRNSQTNQVPYSNIKEAGNDGMLLDDDEKISKKKDDIGIPLMKDDETSPLVSIIEYDTIETVIQELKGLKPTGVHYYGNSGSKAQKKLELEIRSQYFIINDSPLQQCNVFAPLKHYNACGLGRIKGYDGIHIL